VCDYLTIAVPAARVDCVRPLTARRCGLQPESNRWVIGQLEPGETGLQLIRGGCSCDFYLREQMRYEFTADAEHRLRDKYAARGWSAAKIERAVGQVRNRQSRVPEPAPEGFRPEIANLLSDIARAVGRMRFLIHFYDREERFELLPPMTLSSDRLVGTLELEDRWVRVFPSDG